jgi:hypothetical protein
MFRSVPEAELKTLFENVTQELRSHSENQSWENDSNNSQKVVRP